MRKLLLIMVVLSFILPASCGKETRIKKVVKPINERTINSKTDVFKNEAVICEVNAEKVAVTISNTVSILKPGAYLVTSYQGGVHGWLDISYILFDQSGGLCTFNSPDKDGRTGYSKIQNFNEKYYFTFNYKEFMGGENYKEFTKAFEADVSTGMTKEINLNEIPGNALVIQPLEDDGNNYDTGTSWSKTTYVQEDEIAKKTGIVAHPSKDYEGGGFYSQVTGIISGNYVVVSRSNEIASSDTNKRSYDLFAVFEKKTWKKIWERKNVYFYSLIGPFVFMGGILDIATGKEVTPYSGALPIGKINDMLFMFASRDNKPKIVVLNLKKIDQLKSKPTQ